MLISVKKLSTNSRPVGKGPLPQFFWVPPFNFMYRGCSTDSLCRRSTLVQYRPEPIHTCTYMNRPIFSTYVVCINFTLLNIGLFNKIVPSLIPCSLSFYTTIAFKSYIPLTFSERIRMFLYLVSLYIFFVTTSIQVYMYFATRTYYKYNVQANTIV